MPVIGFLPRLPSHPLQSPGQEFLANSWCYQKLAPDAALDPNSTLIRDYLVGQMQAAAAACLYGVPVYRVPANTPTVPVRVDESRTDPWAVQLRAQFAAGVPLPDNSYRGAGAIIMPSFINPTLTRCGKDGFGQRLVPR